MTGTDLTDGRCPVCGEPPVSTYAFRGSGVPMSIPAHVMEGHDGDVVTTESHYDDGTVEIVRVRHTVLSTERRGAPPIAARIPATDIRALLRMEEA